VPNPKNVEPDDSLFELADKAASNEEQNIFFDSMREVRVRRHSIESNFSKSVDEAFSVLVQAQNTSGEDVYDSLKADALSLVHDDDLGWSRRCVRSVYD